MAAAGTAIYAYSRLPVTSDEVAQLWHAKILLSGRLALPVDPNPEFFAVDNMIDRGRWFSQFPIGGPAVLAIGTLFHAAWLLNPLFAGLAVVNIYRFARRAYSEKVARLSAVLAAVSPFITLMDGSYMNHGPVLWLASAALPALFDWSTGSDAVRRRSAVVIGLAIGAAVTIRPLDGAVAAGVFGAFMLVETLRDQTRVKSIVLGAVAGAVPVALLLIANWRTTGSPLRFGYEMLWGPNHSLGVHDDPSGNPHTLKDVLLYLVKYTLQLNWSLWEWPAPGLLLPIITLVLMRRMRKWDVLLLSWFGAQLVAYAFYWHFGQFAGPRYLFTIVPVLIIFGARAPFLAARALPADLRLGVWASLAALLAVAWLAPMAPYGVLPSETAVRDSRKSLKVDVDPTLDTLRGPALVFVPEQISQRITRRLWALGVSRAETAHLLATADGCALLDSLRLEEHRPDSIAARVERLSHVRPFVLGAYRMSVADGAFHVSDSVSVTPGCNAELIYDTRPVQIAYGQLLLRNTIDADGHVNGPVVYVADLTEHNEALRARFGDRPWYRLEFDRAAKAKVPRLVPYTTMTPPQ